MSAVELPISVSVSRIDAEVVVALAGELDLYSLPHVEPLVADLIRGQGNLSVAIDLRDVSFLDSTALSLFVTTHRELDDRGGRFTLRNPTAAARRIFEISGVDRMLHIQPS